MSKGEGVPEEYKPLDPESDSFLYSLVLLSSMGKYVVKYEEWPEEKLKKLGILLNDLMTTLDRVYANDDEEASWLRKFEKNLDRLIDE